MITSNLLTPVQLDTVIGVSVLSSGKILVVGGSLALSPAFYDESTGQYVDATYGDTQFVVARLSSTGVKDSSYGASGLARATYASGNDPGLPSAFAVAACSPCTVKLSACPTNS